MICIDASVFVAAARTAEAQHANSMAFLREVQAQGEEIYCPTLALPECVAAIARRTSNPNLAEQIVLLIEQFPNLHLIALRLPLAQRAVRIAAIHQLRGAAVVPTATPTIWLAETVAGP